MNLKNVSSGGSEGSSLGHLAFLGDDDRQAVTGEGVIGFDSVSTILDLGDLAERDEALRVHLENLSLEEKFEAYREIQDWLALREVVQDEDAIGKVHAAYETLADVLSEGQPAESLEYLLSRLEGGKSGLPEFTDQLMTSVLRKWATKNPLQAAAYIQQHRGRLQKAEHHLYQDLTSDLARVWARADPEAALAWLNKLPNEARMASLKGVVGVLFKSDPERAGELLSEHTNLPERGILSQKLAHYWAQADPAAALAWVGSAEEDVSRQAAEMIIDQWAERDFEEAQKGYQALKGEARDAASRTMSHHYWLESRDFVKAGNFIASEASGPGRDAAARDLVANWARADYPAAAEWLAENDPHDGSFDQAIVELGSSIEERDHRQAAEVYSRIADPETRQSMLQGALDPWFKEAPSDALAWISDDSPLPLNDKELLIARYQNPFPENHSEE